MKLLKLLIVMSLSLFSFPLLLYNALLEIVSKKKKKISEISVRILFFFHTYIFIDEHLKLSVVFNHNCLKCHFNFSECDC